MSQIESMNNPVNLLDQFPDEILIIILGFVPLLNRSVVKFVDRRCRNLINDVERSCARCITIPLNQQFDSKNKQSVEYHKFVFLQLCTHCPRLLNDVLCIYNCLEFLDDDPKILEIMCQKFSVMSGECDYINENFYKKFSKMCKNVEKIVKIKLF